MLRCVVAMLLGAASLSWGAEADDAVVRLMKRASPGVDAVSVLSATNVGAGMRVVVAGGAGRVGVFLRSRDRAGEIHQIVESPMCTPAPVVPRVERVTPSEVVVSCQPSQRAESVEVRRFDYDVRTRSLVRAHVVAPQSAGRLAMTGGKVRFLGPSVGLEYDPEAATLFRAVAGAGPDTGTPPDPVRFGAGKYLEIFSRENAPPVVREVRTEREFPLPKSTREEVIRTWPDVLRQGRWEERANIGESIGPWTVSGDLLWFGRSSDGNEKALGVGGFGFFDPAPRTFRIITPPEVARRSATAIAAGDKAVWVAFARGGSLTGDGGGVLRWDRATERTEFFPLQDRVEAMAVVGERLLMATSFGAAVLEGGNIRRFFVEWTREHKWRVWEGAGAGSCLAERPCADSKPFVVD